MNKIINIDIRQWTQTQRHALFFHLTAFHFITVGMVFGFSVLVIGTSAAARRTSAPQRPFAALSEIFPEQSGQVVEKMGFYCITSPYLESWGEHCALQLTAGSISEVEVVIFGAVIHQVQFSMRGNEVRLGDLMLFLGAPEVHRIGHMIFFFWLNSHIKATAVSDMSPPPLLPLQTVTITTSWEKSFG